jgi:HEAT repeat protein
MNTAFLRACLALCSVIVLLTACSGSGASKVDVKAEIANLKSPDANVRVEALTSLSTLGPKAAPAASALAEALKDSDPLVRRLAGYALMEIGPEAKSVAPAVQEAIKKENDQAAMMQLVNTLKTIDPKAASDMKLMNVSQ